MNTGELLRTKLAPPRMHSKLVPRTSLLAKLDEGMAYRLTSIAAPAGYGKTTLAAQWLATRAEPVAWVSLDAGDNDPVRFWSYVIAACREFEPGLGKPALAALRTSQQPPFEALLTGFLNELAELPNPGILVLEDYHVITSDLVHGTVAFVLDHLPATVHPVVVARSEPPLPLARLRARNQLCEINAADLHFSHEETRAFLQQNLRVSLPAEAITRLEERMEGWVTGLRLLACALEGKSTPPEIEQVVAMFTGSHRHVLEYLVGEVLAAQPEQLQMFLLQTSVLDRLAAPLCDAVTGRADSALVLEQLERDNLFLTRLAGKDGLPWYRYHALFAEATRHSARQRLGEAGVQALLERASVWCEVRGLLGEAVETAIAAQQYARAADLIEQFLDLRDLNGLHTFRRWVEQLPQDVLHGHPGLCFNHAKALLFTSDRYAPATPALVEAPLRVAEAHWRGEENEARLGEVLALRSMVALWQGELARSFANAREALRLLPEDDTDWRGSTTLIAGMGELWAGKANAAQRTLLEARALSAAAQNVHSTLAATLMLGEACLWQADLDRAAQLYQRVLAEAGEVDAVLDDRSQAFLGLGTVAFERNDLASAEGYAAQALEIGRLRGAESLETGAALLLAQVQRACGQIAPAQEMLSTLAANTRQTLLLREIDAAQARLSLAAGDLASVRRWSDACEPGDPDVPALQQELEALLVARMQIAEGEAEAALASLEPWRADAEAHGRTRREMENLCLQALAFAAQDDMARASSALVRALTMAQPKGQQRVFLDEGEKMAALLQAVIPDLGKRPLATYATLLLRVFAEARPAGHSGTRPSPSPILEPLSLQEKRVLRLLAAGLSNPEIAEQLVVSINTVKTQVRSIYRKLNVSSREQAGEAARQLKLL